MKRPYLLRGLMKCAHCGHSFIGTVSQSKLNKEIGEEERGEFEVRGDYLLRPYYMCNSKNIKHLKSGPESLNCPSGHIRAKKLEALVWGEIEGFLTNPESVIGELETLLGEGMGESNLFVELDELRAEAAGKEAERNALYRLFRKGMLPEMDLESQLNELREEEVAIGARLELVERAVAKAKDAKVSLDGARALLSHMREKVSKDDSWSSRRKVVETLVAGIEIETLDLKRISSEMVDEADHEGCRSGECVSTLAPLFGVSATTLWRWRCEWRAHAQVAPCGRGRCAPLLDAGDLCVLEGLLQEHNDLTIDQLHTLWQQQTQRVVTGSTIARAVLRLGWTRKKKSVRASEQKPEARPAWQHSLAQVQASDLVFLDECVSNIALAPAYGRAHRGPRAWGHVPKNRGRNTTILGALSASGWQVGMVLEGAANTLAFEVFIEHYLLPTLRPASSNAASWTDHCVGQPLHPQERKVPRLLEQAQCWLAFLPTYSPDFNPIELAWSKLKTFLRKVAVRTREELEHAIGQGLDTISPKDARNWIKHCGYHLT